MDIYLVGWLIQTARQGHSLLKYSENENLTFTMISTKKKHKKERFLEEKNCGRNKIFVVVMILFHSFVCHENLCKWRSLACAVWTHGIYPKNVHVDNSWKREEKNTFISPLNHNKWNAIACYSFSSSPN